MTGRHSVTQLEVWFPPLQPLLFRHVCLLFFVCGVICFRAPLGGAVCVGLIVLADSRMHPGLSADRLHRMFPGTWLAGVAFFLLGLGVAWRAEPPRAVSLPAWFTETTLTKAITVSGTVESVLGLPDRRLRILLSDVRPLSGFSAEPLQGRVVWTWAHPHLRPLPGQQVTLNAIIRPVRGFLNLNQPESGNYWRDQGVFFQTFTNRNDGNPVLSGEPTVSAARRAFCMQTVIRALASPETAMEVFPPLTPGRALIPALLFGDKFDLRSSDLTLVGMAGLSHSLALSGQHLAIAGLAGWMLILLLGLSVPVLFLHIPSPALLGLCCLPPAAVYLWLGDAPPSLIRAALMLFLFCVLRVSACVPGLFPAGKYSGTRRLIQAFADNSHVAFPDILLVVLALMAAADPLCLSALSVQLSFVCVAGITLCLPMLTDLLRRKRRSFLEQKKLPFWKRWLLKGGSAFGLTLGVSAVAQAVTVPLTLRAFGTTTVWFPLNVLWLPVLGLWVLPIAFLGLCVSLLGAVELGATLLAGAALPCTWLLQGLDWLQETMGLSVTYLPAPHWTALPALAALAVGLALWQRRPVLPAAGKRLVAAGSVLLLIGPALFVWKAWSPEIRVNLLDVGQGQAVLLEWPHGRGLIDGGGVRSRRFDIGEDLLSPLLAANHPLQLDFMAISHSDFDHVGGLGFLARTYQIDSVYTPYFEGDALRRTSFPVAKEPPRGVPEFLASPAGNLLADLFARAVPRYPLQAGDVIPLTDTLRLEVLGPAPGQRCRGNDGLIVRLAVQGRGLALFPGDATPPYLLSLLKTGQDVSAEVLVLPHHGSQNNFTPAFLAAVRPRLALVSAGVANPYGLPSPCVLDFFKKQGIPVLNTADVGGIELVWALNDPDQAPHIRTFNTPQAVAVGKVLFGNTVH